MMPTQFVDECCAYCDACLIRICLYTYMFIYVYVYVYGNEFVYVWCQMLATAYVDDCCAYCDACLTRIYLYTYTYTYTYICLEMSSYTYGVRCGRLNMHITIAFVLTTAPTHTYFIQADMRGKLSRIHIRYSIGNT